jgi:hypothetical protein
MDEHSHQTSAPPTKQQLAVQAKNNTLLVTDLSILEQDIE